MSNPTRGSLASAVAQRPESQTPAVLERKLLASFRQLSADTKATAVDYLSALLETQRKAPRAKRNAQQRRPRQRAATARDGGAPVPARVRRAPSTSHSDALRLEMEPLDDDEPSLEAADVASPLRPSPPRARQARSASSLSPVSLEPMRIVIHSPGAEPLELSVPTPVPVPNPAQRASSLPPIDTRAVFEPPRATNSGASGALRAMPARRSLSVGMPSASTTPPAADQPRSPNDPGPRAPFMGSLAAMYNEESMTERSLKEQRRKAWVAELEAQVRQEQARKLEDELRREREGEVIKRRQKLLRPQLPVAPAIVRHPELLADPFSGRSFG